MNPVFLPHSPQPPRNSLPTFIIQAHHHHPHLLTPQPPPAEAASSQTRLLETLLFFVSPLLLWYPSTNGIKPKHRSLPFPSPLLSCGETQPRSNFRGTQRSHFWVTLLASCLDPSTSLAASAIPSPQLIGHVTDSGFNHDQGCQWHLTLAPQRLRKRGIFYTGVKLGHQRTHSRDHNTSTCR